jgi:hypothetical protein
MENRHLDCVFEPPFPVSAHQDKSTKADISLVDTYFLMLDGFRVGPFLCIGPIDHLEELLHDRGIRIAI